MRKIADAITAEYQRRGFNLARALVPEQNLSAGIAEIRVLEALIGKLTLQGNNYFSNGLIQRSFTGLLSDKAVSQSALERSLLLLGDQYPDLYATAGLQAGAEPGTTNIVITAKDIFPAHLTVDSNNYGVRDTSRYILGTQFDATDPWLGSQFSYRENTGFQPRLTHNRRVGYNLPLNGQGTIFGGYFSTGNFAVGGNLSALGLNGNQEGWGLSLSHTFIRNRFHKLVGEFGFDLRDSKLFQDITLNSLDRIRLLRVGVSYEETDSTGRTFASVFLFRGLSSAFGGSKRDNPQSSRLFVTNSGLIKGADGDFTYGTINLFRLQTITSFLRAVARLSGQATADPLVASEQFGIGGPDTVRGYRFKELVGDNGLNSSFELRVLPIPDNEILQLAIGIDHGLVQQREPAPGQEKYQSLLGYGPGVRLNLPFMIYERPTNFAIRFDVGFPISPSKIDNRTSSVRPVYYVNTALRF